MQLLSIGRGHQDKRSSCVEDRRSAPEICAPTVSSIDASVVYPYLPEPIRVPDRGYPREFARKEEGIRGAKV